jgi:hypothetical protein
MGTKPSTYACTDVFCDIIIQPKPVEAQGKRDLSDKERKLLHGTSKTTVEFN